MIIQAIAALIGLWLMAAPSLLDYLNSSAAINARIAGPLVATVGVVAMAQCTRGLRWIQLALGLWIAVSPAIIESPGPATANHLAVGALLCSLAFVQGRLTYRYGGGWRVLIQRDPYRVRTSI